MVYLFMFYNAMLTNLLAKLYPMSKCIVHISITIAVSGFCINLFNLTFWMLLVGKFSRSYVLLVVYIHNEFLL
jgi:hypothetical protein